jgi:alkylmercury lyase
MRDLACRQILQTLTETGQPIAPTRLATLLQTSQEELATHLAGLLDTEFDEQGNIVGWGITLLPTPHQFLLPARAFFTWCAFDTVLFPPLLHMRAQVQSTCTASGHPITFDVTPEGIEELTPTTSVLSLILPAERSDCVRGTLCQQSLFFESEHAASIWSASHPEALFLSLEEAAFVGQAVARL